MKARYQATVGGGNNFTAALPNTSNLGSMEKATDSIDAVGVVAITTVVLIVSVAIAIVVVVVVVVVVVDVGKPGSVVLSHIGRST